VETKKPDPICILLPAFLAFYVIIEVGDVVGHTLSAPKRAYLYMRDEFKSVFTGVPVGYEIENRNIYYGGEGLANLFSNQRIMLATTGIKLSIYSIFQVLTDKEDSNYHIIRFGYNNDKYSVEVYKGKVFVLKKRRFIMKDTVIPNEYSRLDLYLGLESAYKTQDLNADEMSFVVAWETLKNSVGISHENLLDIILTSDRICIFYINKGEFYMSAFYKESSTYIETINYSDIMDIGFDYSVLSHKDKVYQNLVSLKEKDDSYKIIFSNALLLKSNSFKLVLFNYAKKVYRDKIESDIFPFLIEDK